MNFRKKLKILGITGLLFTMLSTSVVFAGPNESFYVLTRDEHDIPTTGYFRDGSAKAKTGVRVIDYVDARTGGDGTEVANNGHLIYARNGYGGGVSDPTKDSVLHQTSYSFNIMMPHDAMEDSLAKREHAFFNYIPYNRTYCAGPSGQGAYGYPRKYNYPNKANPYTLKLIQADPVTGVFDVDYSGKLLYIRMGYSFYQLSTSCTMCKGGVGYSKNLIYLIVVSCTVCKGTP